MRAEALSFSVFALHLGTFFGCVHTVLHSGYPVQSYALWGRKGSRETPPARASRCWSRNRSWTLPKARVTARVRLRERVSRQDEPTSRVGICLMCRSFGTLGQLNILAQVCNKLGLTRDGRMPDLRSDQCAKQKASEYGARRGPGLFTELFTARYTVVTICSAPGYGHSGSPSSSAGPEGG